MLVARYAIHRVCFTIHLLIRLLLRCDSTDPSYHVALLDQSWCIAKVTFIKLTWCWTVTCSSCKHRTLQISRKHLISLGRRIKLCAWSHCTFHDVDSEIVFDIVGTEIPFDLIPCVPEKWLHSIGINDSIDGYIGSSRYHKILSCEHRHWLSCAFHCGQVRWFSHDLVGTRIDAINLMGMVPVFLTAGFFAPDSFYPHNVYPGQLSLELLHTVLCDIAPEKPWTTTGLSRLHLLINGSLCWHSLIMSLA